ncbi:hypothetical protein KXV52_004625, partial [Aspergillus fumigatus]
MQGSNLVSLALLSTLASGAVIHSNLAKSQSVDCHKLQVALSEAGAYYRGRLSRYHGQAYITFANDLQALENLGSRTYGLVLFAAPVDPRRAASHSSQNEKCPAFDLVIHNSVVVRTEWNIPSMDFQMLCPRAVMAIPVLMRHLTMCSKVCAQSLGLDYWSQTTDVQLSNVGSAIGTTAPFEAFWKIGKCKSPQSCRLQTMCVYYTGASCLVQGFLGNADRFFKNAVMNQLAYDVLQAVHPEVSVFLRADGSQVIPTAWLIERCGWKGRRIGRVGVYDQHALVIVYYGSVNGFDVLEFASRIREGVMGRFGIWLEFEVRIVTEVPVIKKS